MATQEVNLFNLLESRRLEEQEQNAILHKRITELKDDIYEEISASHKEIMKEIKEMKEESKVHHEKMDERLTELERWKWVVIGGASVIGFLVAIATDLMGFFT